MSAVGAGAGEDIAEHVGGVARLEVVVGGVLVGVPQGVDVEHVRLAPAGGHHVQRFPRRRRGDVGVGAFDGAALGTVSGRRVSQLDVLPDIGRGQIGDPAAGRPSDAHRTVGVDLRDDPLVAVLDPLPHPATRAVRVVASDQLALVEPAARGQMRLGMRPGRETPASSERSRPALPQVNGGGGGI